MAGPVYSTRFGLATSVFAIPHTLFFVPVGYVWVVKEVMVSWGLTGGPFTTYLEHSPSTMKMFVYTNGGLAPPPGSYIEKNLHTVLYPGESLAMISTSATVDVEVSGYALLLP